jgi:hypothetical protein
MLLSGMVEPFMANIVHRERISGIARLRELVIIGLVTYAAASLGRSVPFPERFLASTENVTALVFVAMAWFVTRAIHMQLRPRELVLSTFQGVPTEEFHRLSRDSVQMIAESLSGVKRVRLLCVFFLSVLVILAILEWAITGAITPWGSILIAVAFGLSFAALASLNSFADEYYYLGEGLLPARRHHRRRSWFAAGILVSALALALLAASPRSILPLSAIAAFLSWLGGLFPRFEPSGETPPAGQQEIDRYSYIREQLSAIEEAPPPPRILLLLVEVLERLALAAAILLVAGFVLAPLVSPSFRRFLRRSRPVQAIRERLSFVTRGFSLFIAFLRRRLGRKPRRPVAGESPSANEEVQLLWRDRLSPLDRLRKDRERGFLRSELRKLLWWMRDQGIRVETNWAPHELSEAVAKSTPDRSRAVTEFFDIYEQGRYGRFPIDNRARRRLRALTANITSAR